MSDTETKPDVRDGIIHTAIPADEVARLSDDIVAAMKAAQWCALSQAVW